MVTRRLALDKLKVLDLLETTVRFPAVAILLCKRSDRLFTLHVHPSVQVRN
jgi:hypothetical protein